VTTSHVRYHAMTVLHDCDDCNATPACFLERRTFRRACGRGQMFRGGGQIYGQVFPSNMYYVSLPGSESA